MATGSFPSDPASRKAILVLAEPDVEQCRYAGVPQILRDEEAYVLQFPVRSQTNMPAALQNIIDAGLARRGSVLVQSPYDPDIYEDAIVAPQRYALVKKFHFSRFCMHLGAKEVSVTQIQRRIGVKKQTLGVDIEGKVLGAGLQGGHEELEQFGEQMSLRDEFLGGPPDIAAAEQLLLKTHLMADSCMQSLLEMRRYGGRDGANQLSTRTLVLSLSSETKRNLSIIGRLKIPLYLKTAAEYNRVVEEQHDYTLTVAVRF